MQCVQDTNKDLQQCSVIYRSPFTSDSITEIIDDHRVITSLNELHNTVAANVSTSSCHQDLLTHVESLQHRQKDRHTKVNVITGSLLTGMWVCPTFTQLVRALRGFAFISSILFYCIWMELFHSSMVVKSQLPLNLTNDSPNVQEINLVQISLTTLVYTDCTDIKHSKILNVTWLKEESKISDLSGQNKQYNTTQQLTFRSISTHHADECGSVRVTGVQAGDRREDFTESVWFIHSWFLVSGIRGSVWSS